MSDPKILREIADDLRMVAGQIETRDLLIRQLLESLRFVEWVGEPFGRQTCPRCEGVYATHKPGCRLAAALAKAKATTPSY